MDHVLEQLGHLATLADDVGRYKMLDAIRKLQL